MKYKEIPDITLKMIINAGIIKVGTKVYSSPNNEIIGTLDKEGAITLEIDNEMKTFPFPSGAGRAITKISVNGWKYWRILDNGTYNELSYYKEIYKQTVGQP
ncbi:MAG: restriction system modified-DNA reader domain-containing protein [Flagellimonas sp.]